jgi:hypothetical protein
MWWSSFVVESLSRRNLILFVPCIVTTITHIHQQMHTFYIFIYTIPLHEFCYKCEMTDLLKKASNCSIITLQQSKTVSSLYRLRNKICKKIILKIIYYLKANEFTLGLLVLHVQPGGHQYICTLCHQPNCQPAILCMSNCHLTQNNAATNTSTDSMNLLLAMQINTFLFCQVLNFNWFLLEVTRCFAFLAHPIPRG